ncbi:MAG: DUF2177 family protein [Anaplasmataceae bacterium]|nr:DUF2177 family protein [Anaplasmataceae bacterium]
MKQFIISYVVAAVVMLGVDAIWLSVMSKKFYATQIGHLMSETPKLGPAAIFYIIYILGLTILVLQPALQNNFDYPKVLLWGAVFGMVAYATYDLTNQATLRDWPVIVTVVDIIWGTILTGVVSGVAVYVTQLFK